MISIGPKTGEGTAAAPFPLPHPDRVSNNGEGVYTIYFIVS